MIKTNEDFVWAVEVPLTGKFIIEIEFLDLKTASPDVCIYLILISLSLIFSVLLIANDNDLERQLECASLAKINLW